MKTPLDDSDSWFMHGIAYKDDELLVYLAEGIASEPQQVTILGTVVDGAQSIDVGDDSRLFLVRFRRIVAWQVIDESYTQWDEYEIRDDKNFLQCLSRSKYLDYINANHGWYEMTLGPASHYRIWTKRDVVDVVSCEQPEIEEWSPA